MSPTLVGYALHEAGHNQYSRETTLRSDVGSQFGSICLVEEFRALDYNGVKVGSSTSDYQSRGRRPSGCELHGVETWRYWK